MRRIELMKAVIAKKQLDVTVVLENVHDAHNIGAVLRTCETVGIQEVYLLFTDDDLFQRNLKLGKRTSSGARKWLDVFLYNNLEECIEKVRDRFERLIGTVISTSSNSLYEVDFTESCALILGNEKSGLSDNLANELDEHIVIPQVGFVQSLNVSVANAVCLYEMFRQRSNRGAYDKNFDINDANQLSLLENYLDRSNTRGYGRKPLKRFE